MNNVERFVLALQGGRPDRIPVLPKIWLDTAAKLAGVDLTDIAGQPQSATRLIPQVAAQFGFDAARLHLFPEHRLEKGESATWELDATGQRLGPMDPLGGMEVGRAREILGPGYCLMGGVNTMTLAKGTPAEVLAECRTVLARARAREGAFILGSGCALSRLTSAANLQALIDIDNGKTATRHVLNCPMKTFCVVLGLSFACRCFAGPHALAESGLASSEVANPGATTPSAHKDARPHRGMHSVVAGLFDDESGQRLGRMRIERVGLEYGRRGFLRVAWHPLVLLEGVTIDLDAGASWPAVGTQIVRALQIGGEGPRILRHVCLCVAGSPARRIMAPVARLGAEGGLELSDATVADADRPARSVGTICFWLTGPHAGQWTPVTAAPVPVSASPSPPSGSLQLSSR